MLPLEVRPSSWRAPLALALVLSAVAGCQRLSPEAIEGWKRAPDGQGIDRLVAAVKDPSGPAPLRAAAAAALVEVEASDRMEAAVAGLDLEQRAGLIPAAVPLLGRLLDDGARGGDAREALHALREQATTGAARSEIDAVLLPALEKDVRSGREQVGRRRVKDILVAIGAGALPRLLALLDDPKIPLETAVEVVDKLGDAPAREQGGAALVRRAKASPRPVVEPLWVAMATLGGKDVAAFLEAEVGGAEAARAALAMTKLRRHPAVLPFALKTAAAPGTAADVRERMFEVAQGLGTEDARKGLVALVGSAEDEALRYRAFEAALKAGRGAALLPALEALPASARYRPEDVQGRLVRPISDLPGMETREGLFKALESKAPLARLVGILALEKMGFASDAQFVGKLVNDKGTIRGLKEKVGQEAERVVAALKKSTT